MKISQIFYFMALFFMSLFLLNCEDEAITNSASAINKDVSLQKNSLPNSEFIKVFYTDREIEIDGVEEDWVNAPKHILRQYYDLTGPINDKFDLYSYFRMSWNDDNLYIFVNILDDSISVNADLPFDKDSFELFLDADNSKNTPPDENIPHPYPGSYDFNDEQIRFIWQEEPTRFPWFYDVSPLEYAYLETDKGWNLEIKIPFTTLVDFPAEAGHVFGVEFHVNDNDGDGRENFVKWWSESDYTFLYPSLFGSAYLFKSNGN